MFKLHLSKKLLYPAISGYGKVYLWFLFWHIQWIFFIKICYQFFTRTVCIYRVCPKDLFHCHSHRRVTGVRNKLKNSLSKSLYIFSAIDKPFFRTLSIYMQKPLQQKFNLKLNFTINIVILVI